MEQREIAPSISEWFLIASKGDMVVRILPGMLLGETDSGDVSFFDPSCAQVELDIAYDGSVVLSAADNFELECAGGKRSRREYLTRHHRAEVQLPHNVMQIDTDFANRLAADDTVGFRLVPMPKATAKAKATQIVLPDCEPDSEAHLDAPADAAVEARRLRGAREAAALRTAPMPGFEKRRTQRIRVRRQQPIGLLVAVWVAVAALALVLLYQVLRDDPIAQLPAPAEVSPASQTVPVQAADLITEIPARDSEVALTTIRVPPLHLRLLELATSQPTETVPPQQVAAQVSQSPSAPESTAEPRVSPPPEPRPEPRVEPTARAPVERDSARTVAERSSSTLPVAARTRLPAEDLRSVRQRLINRSLAELASGEFRDARSSLQAAANAGADPKLVTDLHAEIDYREQLSEGRNP